ncbi:hypothetical protein GCM10009413_20250 [Tatumella punctata]
MSSQFPTTVTLFPVTGAVTEVAGEDVLSAAVSAAMTGSAMTTALVSKEIRGMIVMFYMRKKYNL